MALGLDQLLAHVVERKGFHVQGADNEALFAKKGEETLLAAWKTDAPLSLEDANMFLTALAQVGAASGILVAPKGADQAAKDALSAGKGVEVWAESRLVVEVGEALVKAALDAHVAAPAPASAFPPAQAAAPAARGPTKFPSLVSQAVSASSGSGNGIAYYLPNKKKEPPADMRANIPQQRGGALGYAWGGAAAGTTSAGIATTMPSKPRIKTDQWGNMVRPGEAAVAAPTVVEDAGVEIITTPRRARAAPAAAPAPLPLASAVVDADEDAYEILPSKREKPAPALREAPAAPACTTLKLRTSKDDAVAATGKPGSAKLALVPHVAFEFDLEMSRPGMTAPVTAKGAVLVNSITGEVRAVDALEFDASEPADARKDAEKLTAVDVYDKVKAHVARTYARTMNVERELAGNTVMETVKLSPDPEEMGLQHRGIVHVPVWEITGSTGIAKVDAYTGVVLG